jgi:periplasmic divalent cation tolerance protein
MSVFMVALTTCPKDISEELARGLVEEKVCACVNIISGIKSIYHWKDEIVTDEEALLLIKTEMNHRKALWKAIKQRHPYEVPEFIVLPIEWGSRDYLDWISTSILK